MLTRHLISVPLAALLAGGCQFQSKSTSLLPTAPSDIAAALNGAPATGSSSASGGGSSAPSASSGSPSTSPAGSSGGFAGTWASTTLPGLPNISSCTDLNWEITSQTSSSIAGVVSAVCGSVADITATLTGQMESDDLVNLTARGQAVAFGAITCPFDLTGTGRRESADAWRLDYRGTTCLGPVNGSEMLRRPSAAPAPAPEPEPQPSPSPSPSPSPAPAPAPSPKAGVACAGNTGKQIVDCVERAYPSLLAAHVSLQTRTANMQFLRDKIIETAKCKGMDVGLNLKRGGPSISTDFVTWRHDGILEGVDVGAGYDDTSKPLDLMWYTYGPPNYGFPYYKDYGSVQC